MIIRKPYAFFIKHFRLIHFILSFLMIYCLNYSRKLLTFFNEYIMDGVNLKGQELVSLYAPGIYQILPFLIIGILTLILVVMFLKKKPKILYIANVAVFIFVAIIIQVSKSTLFSMETSILDPRALRLMRDMVMISFIIQIVGTVLVLIRTIGFDVKKFDFKQDLKELEIDETDREEIEVDFNFDKNKFKTSIRRGIRFFKYFYEENKLLVRLGIGILSCIILIAGTVFFISMDRPAKENEFVSNNGITLKINDSYITNTDYKGNVISEDSLFIILKISLKSQKSSTDTLDIATTKLKVGNYSYLPTYEYKTAFMDFGSTYLGENLSKEFQEKVLVYQIPKQFKKKKITFEFVNKSTLESKKVKLNLNDLTKNTKTIKANLTEELSFEDSIISGYKIKINNYFIQSKYKLSYNFCYNNECSVSYEYLVPTIDTNTDKSILRINGTMTTTTPIAKLNNLYNVIDTFGTIYYTVNGRIKTNQISLKQIVSTKKKEENVFYIEVPKDIENAETISIKFSVRNKIYEYVLK